MAPLLPVTVPAQRPIAIICALAQEAAAVRSVLAYGADLQVGPLTVYTGTINDVPVQIVECGVGKVDAATSAAIVAMQGVAGFVVAGVAGSLNPLLPIGDIVVATRLIQHDYGRATDDGILIYAPGQLPVPEVAPELPGRLDPVLEQRVRTALEGVSLPPVSLRLDAPPRRPAVHFGTIVTGDVFVNSPRLRQRLADLGALAVDMESAAVWRVAERFGVPCLVLRAASDQAGRESAHDLAAFLPAAVRSVARLLGVLLPVIAPPEPQQTDPAP